MFISARLYHRIYITVFISPRSYFHACFIMSISPYIYHPILTVFISPCLYHHTYFIMFISPYRYRPIISPCLFHQVSQSDERSSTLCCLCCTSAPISCTFCLDKTGYVPGESILVRGDIVNGSSRKIASSTARLMMVSTHVYIFVYHTIYTIYPHFFIRLYHRSIVE